MQTKDQHADLPSGPPRGSQSIRRAVAVLRAVSKNNNRGARLSEIAREVELHIATAHRLLSALTAEGLIIYDPISKRYNLGIELFLLGGEARQYTLRDRFRTALEDISRQTGDTVFLLIRSGNDALCIDRVEGQYPIRTVPIEVGARRPLGIGAGSLALIAFLPDDQLETIIKDNETRYPQFKNLTAADIRRLVPPARASGYTVSQGLFHEGVTSVGVPILTNRSEIVAAITVSAITQRMELERREAIATLVTAVASASLGTLNPNQGGVA